MKPWHQTKFDVRDVVGMADIMDMANDKFTYASLRNYATHRRNHRLYGPMPQPVARIANRPVWLKREIEFWLGDPPIPKWRWTKEYLRDWKKRRADTMREWETQRGNILTT